MTATSYIGKIQEDGTIFVPKDAQEELGLQPGDEIQIQLMPPTASAPQPHAPNMKALAALKEIAERQKDQPYSDGSDTLRLLREGRDGAMYGYDSSE